jgi:hypothetical protein
MKHAERNISFSEEQHHVLPHPFQIEAAVSNYKFTTKFKLKGIDGTVMWDSYFQYQLGFARRYRNLQCLFF